MTNGSERLDRIERILEQNTERHNAEMAEIRETLAAVSKDLAAVSEDRAAVSEDLAAVSEGLRDVAKRQHEMAARQQYHDEAFERHDAEMKVIREAIAADAENIRALARISEIHHQRLERLEGEEPA
ncbi:MAG: hypothetical protein ACKV22_09730 [Bryobacteraceae bacterium]